MDSSHTLSQTLAWQNRRWISPTHEFQCQFDDGFLPHTFLNTAMTKLAMDSFYAEAHFKIDYGFLYKIGDGFPVHTNSNVKMDDGFLHTLSQTLEWQNRRWISPTHEFQCKFDDGFLPHTFLNTAMTKSAMDSFYSEAHFKIDYGFLPHTFVNSSMTTSAMDSSYTRIHCKIDDGFPAHTFTNTSITKSAMDSP